jgi:hypothetical protein
MNDEIVVLPCNFQHFFMKDCIQDWFSQNEICPVCRFEVFNHHNYRKNIGGASDPSGDESSIDDTVSIN